MNRKQLSIVLAAAAAAVMLLAFGSAGANALPCNTCDPDPGPGGTTTPKTAHLTVVQPAMGSVVDATAPAPSSTGEINCGSDCTQSYAYSHVCDADDVCGNVGVKNEKLDTTAVAGYSPLFHVCQSNATGTTCTGETVCSGNTTCSLTMDQDYRVRVEWLDSSPPSAPSITGPSMVGPNQRHFSATATDNVGVTSMRFYLDGAQQAVDSSAPFEYDVPVDFGDGAHTLSAQAVDAEGNLSDAGSKSITIDTGEPSVTITSPRPGQNDHVASPFTPTYTVADDFTPTDALDVKCKVNNDPYGACTSLQASEGSHTLFVKATDQAGNFHVEGVGFTVDSTGPQVTITSGPPDNSIITVSSATYAFTASDGTAPLSSTCKLDNGAAAACSSPVTFSNLPEGNHTFTLRVTDGVGNATQVTRDVFVNAIGPSAAITSGPAAGDIVRSTSVTFGFSTTGGAVSCSLDSETAFRPCSGATSDSLSNLAQGAHTFRVRVVDESSDTVIVSRTFRVDTSVAPPPPPKVDVLNPSLSTRYVRFPKYTRYKRLVLKRVPAGSTITVKCKGKKCPAKSFHKKGHGTVKLSKFAKKKLRPGTKLTIRVTKPGAIGKQFVILIRKGKAPKLTISQIA